MFRRFSIREAVLGLLAAVPAASSAATIEECRRRVKVNPPPPG